MEYSEADLPVEIKHGETLKLNSGQDVRWESNGEAKCVYLSYDFEPTVELFPSNSYEFEEGGNTYKLTARFEDALLVEKV